MTVNVDQTEFERAKKNAINVSQALTNYLKFLNDQIEATNTKNKSFLDPTSFTKEAGCGLRDLNPGRQVGNCPVDWAGFRDFVGRDHRPDVASQLLSNAEKYGGCLFRRDLSAIQALDDTVRNGAMCGLSALSKFLGCHDDFRALVKSYGLRWTRRSKDDLIIERLTRDSDPEEIWAWIRSVKQQRPELGVFMDYSAATGLRFQEAVHSYNLIGELTRQGKLGAYYSADKSTLEHYRFKDVFIRRSKKAFVSFVPADMVQAVAGGELLNGESVRTVVRRKHLPLRFGDIREAHGTFMIRHLKKEEVDFLHGRVTSGVFMQHYFNPSLIVDLKERVFRGVAEIQEKIRV